MSTQIAKAMKKSDASSNHPSHEASKPVSKHKSPVEEQDKSTPELPSSTPHEIATSK
jgi:hypothetical protein